MPSTAPAAYHERYGAPRLVGQRELAVPAPPDDGVVVRVRAAGINRGDGLAIEGIPYAARLSYGITRPKHRVPGTDVAGVVAAVGPDVTTLTVGDAVYGWARGAFARYAAASAGDLTRKPDTLTYEEAAAVPTAAVTALQALRLAGIESGRASGQRVLAIGASGGVGSFAVQLATAYGAVVTGVCSNRNVDLVRSFGARHVVDYTQADPTAERRRYDAVLDLAGRAPLTRARRTLRRGGTYVVVGGGEPRSLTGLRRFAAAVLLSPFGPERLRPLFASPEPADLEVVTGLLASGDVAPYVEAAYDLRDAADAVEYVHRGRARGKVVLVP
ncbi:UNVERIFIED_CONTAM: hypothetical protein LK11_18010 [Mumia flava]